MTLAEVAPLLVDALGTALVPLLAADAADTPPTALAG